jgi:hypothetical protein
MIEIVAERLLLERFSLRSGPGKAFLDPDGSSRRLEAGATKAPSSSREQERRFSISCVVNAPQRGWTSSILRDAVPDGGITKDREISPFRFLHCNSRAQLLCLLGLRRIDRLKMSGQ